MRICEAMKTYAELANILGVPEQRVMNLLWRARFLYKEEKPSLHWGITEEGAKYYCSGYWNDSVIDILEDKIDEQGQPLIADKSHIDHNRCNKCGKNKPYYEFFESLKNESGLSKWCKTCH